MVDPVVCNAPGYSPGAANTVLSESFDAGELPPNWTIVNNAGNGTWYINTGASPCGDLPGNMTGGSGPYALIDSDCDGLVTDDASLVTPSLDLSSFSAVQLAFDQDYFNVGDGDEADVDVSPDGGTTWNNVLKQTSSARGPNHVALNISSAGGNSNVKVRFHYYNAFFAWWWQVDDVVISAPTCVAGPGGLVVGNVRDANTGAGVNGANVMNVGGGSATTVATPNDPNLDDGFYILFAESGQQSFQASKTDYRTSSQSALVVPNSAQRLDFSLGAGDLTAAPSPINGRVDPGGTDNQTLTLTNSGTNSATFNILEIDAPLLTTVTHGFASRALSQKALDRLPQAGGKAIQNLHSTRGVPGVPNPTAGHRPLTAGNVIASYPSGISGGWGVATSGADFWLTNIPPLGGDNKAYEYASTTGASTGSTIDESSAIQAWGGDGAYDSRTGMMWQVDVVNAGSSCIFEVDPVNKVVTGNRICPNTGQSSRGLAYNPSDDTWYVGSFNDLTLYHFDSAGNVIDSANTGLPISGLAYNANNGHLLVMSNTDSSIPDITVLDANNNYAVLGSYNVTINGSEAFAPFGQAGLEFDCIGNLWAIDQSTQTVFNVESDENVRCALDIPWLSENPTTGTVGAGARPAGGSGSTFPVAVTFDGTGLLPGLRQAQLQIQTDTPYAVPGIPVTLTVRFLDVPDDNQFQAFIYGAAGAGVMFGGPPVCSDNLHFCPNGIVTRADMAGYLFRAAHGANTPPPVYQNTFVDVSFNDYNSFYIQGILDDGVTVGCHTNPNLYCPNVPVTRAQMSVLVWKDQHGSTAPHPCTGVFADVPCPDGFAVDYIEGLFHEGVTAGCGGGNFCPNTPITNGQMAVFMVKAFNIPFLP
jgi:S-layer homology domain